MSALDVEAVLRDHEPVLGRMGPLTGIVGCSCLSARDYRAAGFKAGQAGWRAHVAAVLREHIESAQADAFVEGYGVGHNHAETHAGWGPELVNPYRASLAATEGDRQ